MSQKLPVNSFKWVGNYSEFDGGIIWSYNEKSVEGYFLEVDFLYLEELHGLHDNLPFLPERMKI